ncbi:RluA family pseudouridine synthase [Hyalangium rubrum]|uniref:RNA pseudouridine synthase n=1 Tax=Hyalangium rubrum TaxID=3103134 RepID=A0ABU5HDB4_9BACT|nr:RNA pseudouridine synthase [Hyalangium sp. s54d21]MDY7231455.1 RNA pseudouridine synthase [Hyalangium sp. s54d21]
MTELRVLHEGAGLLVVAKPAGVLVIPGRGEGSGPSLREQLEAQLRKKVFVVHRLDRDTSGVLVFALDAERHRALSQAFEAGKVKKRYLALVEGRVEAPQLVDAALVAGRKGRMRVARPGEEGKPSRTRVRPVETFAKASLVEAEPLTGRTHQIRVHLLQMGHPLLVDHQYGREEPLTEKDLGGAGEAVVLARTPLHAARLEWPALPGVEARALEAPMPEDMAQTAALLRQTSS